MKVFFYTSAFVCALIACSNPANSGNAGKASDSILTDTSGVSLGNSPDGAYRLFKSPLPAGGNAIKLLRLSDMKQTQVATSAKDPKFYWSSDSRYLMADNDAPDSTYKQQVVFFNLINFRMEAPKNGQMLAYDQINNMLFLYRYTAERQLIVYFHLSTMDQELQREIITPPGDKIPSAILHPAQRSAKVKAYMTDGVPVNIGFNY